MKKRIRLCIILLSIQFVSFASMEIEFEKPTTITDFSLRSTNGPSVSTSDYNNAKGFIIIFTCNHCPFAKLYAERLNQLNEKYAQLNVPLIAINSMDTLIYKDESFDEMKQMAIRHSFNFPYLQDDFQFVGKMFGAEHTPTAYVIWKEGSQWIIRYKGAIDSNGMNPEIAKPFVMDAVNELLEKKPVSMPITASFGCAIYYRK